MSYGVVGQTNLEVRSGSPDQLYRLEDATWTCQEATCHTEIKSKGSLKVKSMKKEDVLVVKLKEETVTVEETVNEEVALGTVDTIHHNVKLIVKDLPVEGGCGSNAHSAMVGVAVGQSNTKLELMSGKVKNEVHSREVDRPIKCTSGHGVARGRLQSRSPAVTAIPVMARAEAELQGKLIVQQDLKLLGKVFFEKASKLKAVLKYSAGHDTGWEEEDLAREALLKIQVTKHFFELHSNNKDVKVQNRLSASTAGGWMWRR